MDAAANCPVRKRLGWQLQRQNRRGAGRVWGVSIKALTGSGVAGRHALLWIALAAGRLPKIVGLDPSPATRPP